MLSEPIAVTLRVVEALDRLEVPYLIGGSLASAVHGVVRTTMDADLVADLRPEHAGTLAQDLSGDFYVDAESIREAIQQRSSFNVIHLQTMFKVDIFIPKQRPYDRSQMARRAAQVMVTDPERRAYVAAAEDTVLAKLEWYRLGGEISERQWRDVLGVLAVQGERLDLAYLRRWAAELGVADLLARALAVSGSRE
ncbi:MAG: hypothetical protein IT330_10005 [Anaerolineae bacterium]|nr:hypothetical protein [Anaerolineae bacterium]